MRNLSTPDAVMHVDHRNSPGLPGMPEGALTELDIIVCSHCNQQLVKNPLRTRDRAYCGKCHHYICDSCGAAQAVSPTHCSWTELLDRAEKAARRGLSGFSLKELAHG